VRSQARRSGQATLRRGPSHDPDSLFAHDRLAKFSTPRPAHPRKNLPVRPSWAAADRPSTATSCLHFDDGVRRVAPAVGSVLGRAPADRVNPGELRASLQRRRVSARGAVMRGATFPMQPVACCEATPSKRAHPREVVVLGHPCISSKAAPPRERLREEILNPVRSVPMHSTPRFQARYKDLETCTAQTAAYREARSSMKVET
jgi:hypothetical protein